MSEPTNGGEHRADASTAPDAAPAPAPAASADQAAPAAPAAPASKEASKPTTTAPSRRTAADPKKVSTVDAVRTWVASVVWLVAVVAALFLAVGALVIALEFNLENPIVEFVTETAARLDLGELKSFEAGKGAASQQDALTKSVLVNWGIAAVAYLVVGKILDRVIRP